MEGFHTSENGVFICKNCSSPMEITEHCESCGQPTAVQCKICYP